ncbi:hypothetical protein [Flavobacterium sp.]|nr:hypothetical protein [Flavobacterium sp.]
MEDNAKSKLVKQIALFVVVFALTFFGTKYLIKAYLPKQKPAAETGSPNQ